MLDSVEESNNNQGIVEEQEDGAEDVVESTNVISVFDVIIFKHKNNFAYGFSRGT